MGDREPAGAATPGRRTGKTIAARARAVGTDVLLFSAWQIRTEPYGRCHQTLAHPWVQEEYDRRPASKQQLEQIASPARGLCRPTSGGHPQIPALLFMDSSGPSRLQARFVGARDQVPHSGSGRDPAVCTRKLREPFRLAQSLTRALK
jgi:hypothetical protein